MFLPNNFEYWATNIRVWPELINLFATKIIHFIPLINACPIHCIGVAWICSNLGHFGGICILLKILLVWFSCNASDGEAAFMCFNNNKFVIHKLALKLFQWSCNGRTRNSLKCFVIYTLISKKKRWNFRGPLLSYLFLSSLYMYFSFNKTKTCCTQNFRRFLEWIWEFSSF